MILFENYLKEEIDICKKNIIRYEKEFPAQPNPPGSSLIDWEENSMVSTEKTKHNTLEMVLNIYLYLSKQNDLSELIEIVLKISEDSKEVGFSILKKFYADVKNSKGHLINK